tara:strand:- start:110 stop:331 length:222 start_codon:yes stop_codon:yes gene_type:complete
MKKIVIVIIGALFVSCNSEKADPKLNQGWTFEKVTNAKNQGFNFEKKIKATIKNESDESGTHTNCTAPCCSKD